MQASSSNAGRNARRSRVVALVLAIGGACFAVGRISVREQPAPACQPSTAPVELASALRKAQPPDEPQPRTPKRMMTIAPVHLTQAPDEQAAEELRAYEAKQGRELVGLLRERVRFASVTAADPSNHQMVLARTDDYLSGWADGLIRTSPTLADDLAYEIENALCDPATPAVEVMMYARLGRAMPELTSATGFDCVLSTGIEEGPILWEMLGTLNASGLPAPKSLAAIDARAKDERTLMLLHPERRIAAIEESAQVDEPELDPAEQKKILDGLLAERSTGLAPLPSAAPANP